MEQPDRPWIPPLGRATQTPKPRIGRTHPAVAGMLLVATILACAAIGLGLGALVGAAVPLGLVGLFVGVPVGLALIRQRFGDI